MQDDRFLKNDDGGRNDATEHSEVPTSTAPQSGENSGMSLYDLERELTARINADRGAIVGSTAYENPGYRS